MSKKSTPANRREAGKRPNIAEIGLAFRFKPGQSGNPSGKPRDVVACVMRGMLPDPCPYGKDNKAAERSWAEAIALAIFRKALRGDVSAFVAIADRTEGKPRQAIELSGSVDTAYAGMTIQDLDAKIAELLSRATLRAKQPAVGALPGPPLALPGSDMPHSPR